MKNRFTQTLILVGLVVSFNACTKFSDDMSDNLPSHTTLNPEKIDTKLKVINLKVDQSEFDYMMTNYTQEIEIEGVFELFKNKEKIIELDETEIEIKGATSAALPLKTLGVKFDKKYKNEDNDFNLINPDIVLPHHSLEKIKSLRFRNSGNDFEYSMMKDMALTKLAIQADLNLDLMYSDQCLVFVNNSFYGILNMRTESNKHGMAGLYDEDKDDVTLIKIVDGEPILKDGEISELEELEDIVKNKNTAALKSKLDLNNFIDYALFESFVGNVDWPHNNVRFYSINGSKFRFVLYDLDYALLDDREEDHEHFIDNKYDNFISSMFNLLEDDEEFEELFEKRKEELISSGKLEPYRFNSIVNGLTKNIKYWMPYQIEKYKAPKTLSNWFLNIEELKLSYKERFGHMIDD